MRIHPKGFSVIIVILSILLVILLAINLIFPEQTYIHYIFYGLAFVFFFMVVRFFRRPRRKIDYNENNILSAADGKVVALEEIVDGEYFHEKMMLISVFMSPLNVHVNRSPIGGTIKYIKHHPGKYYVAYNPKSSKLNERKTIVFEDEKGRNIQIRQIAGAVARRIVCVKSVGDTIMQGDEIGIIKFGSRVDHLIPLDAKVKVELHQEVRGGKSVLASFR